MASVIWMSVFFFLCAELVVVALLVLPFPNAVRTFIATKILAFNLGPRVRTASQWITFALVFALVESVTTLQRLEKREEAPLDPTASAYDARLSPAYLSGVSLDRQRKFRAERNMYLAGFALTLLFVIARIIELTQFNVTLTNERDRAKKALDDAASIGADREATDITPDSNSSTLRQRKND